MQQHLHTLPDGTRWWTITWQYAIFPCCPLVMLAASTAPPGGIPPLDPATGASGASSSLRGLPPPGPPPPTSTSGASGLTRRTGGACWGV
eukprot:6744012-Alexandrium_andersonii.AAC.1